MNAPEWELINNIELFADLDLRTDDLRTDDHAPDDRLGAVVARPHPTGWFLSAHHRRDLRPEQVRNFAEFARVRAFLLLTEGPRVSTWEPVGDTAWIAWSNEEHLDLVVDVPDAIPAHWS